jgi:hypothetical protein
MGDVYIPVENNFSWYVFYSKVQEEPQKRTLLPALFFPICSPIMILHGYLHVSTWKYMYQSNMSPLGSTCTRATCLHLEVHVPEQVKMVWPAHVTWTLVPLMYQRNLWNLFSLRSWHREYVLHCFLDSITSSLPSREGTCSLCHTDLQLYIHSYWCLNLILHIHHTSRALVSCSAWAKLLSLSDSPCDDAITRYILAMP